MHCGSCTRRYELGSGLLKLGLQALSRFDIVGATIDRALLLRDETQQTTVVSVFGERGLTVIGWFDGILRLIVNSHVENFDSSRNVSIVLNTVMKTSCATSSASARLPSIRKVML